ncbi:unnamed protein product, partial [Musa acuminata subsp. burmannicoides]
RSPQPSPSCRIRSPLPRALALALGHGAASESDGEDEGVVDRSGGDRGGRLGGGGVQVEDQGVRQGWEWRGSVYCCNETVSEYLHAYRFENLFSKPNAPVAHAVGFWDYQSFITAAALYEPLGFGTTGDKQTKMKEVAAFLGHVGSKTSCAYGVVTGGPLAWGLCIYATTMK